jgi:hypothetical protein
MVVFYSSGPGPGPARSLVIAAGGGRDLAWPHQRVAAELLARSSGRLVHLLLHGGARGADAAIAHAAHQLGWCSLVMPAEWGRHGRAAGPIRNRELLEQAIARAVAHTSPGSITSGAGGGLPGWSWHGLAGAAGAAYGFPLAGPDLRGGGPAAMRLPRPLKPSAPDGAPCSSSFLLTIMAVLTPIPAAPADAPAAAPSAKGPACSLQRVAPQGAPGKSASLGQLGIEAQELTTAIGQLAEQLETDAPEQRASVLAELEAALLAEEGNKAALSAKAVAERFRAAVATCWVIEHLRGQAAYRHQQSKRLAALAGGDTCRSDALEESLIFLLTQLQPSATRFSFPNHELSSRKSQAVVIDDKEALAPEWFAVTTTSKPDKAAIKKALKAGRAPFALGQPRFRSSVILPRQSWSRLPRLLLVRAKPC